MKKTILITVLIMTVLFIFSTVSHAQYNINFGSHGAMANLAEKERVAKEQNATAKKNENIATNTKAADTEIDKFDYAEKAYSYAAEETDWEEK